jgi:hypothetical protein
MKHDLSCDTWLDHNEPCTCGLAERVATAKMQRLLEITAYNLYMATLVGNPAPRVKQLYDRITKPQVGDMVLETSTIWMEDRNGTRMGKLLRVVREPMYTDEEWSEMREPIPLDTFWYIELPDGSEFRWYNCGFIAIPPRIDAYQHFGFNP